MAFLKPSLLTLFLIVCCCGNFGTLARRYYCKDNNRYGYCELYENCKYLREIPLTNEMRSNTHCARSGLIGDVVCCFDRKTADVSATIHEKDYMNRRGLALLNQHDCGTIGDSRVANGIDALLGEFPWIALLLYSQKSPLCGGSVITDRFVLTAAHCILHDLQLVRLGEHKLSTEVDCVPLESVNYCQTHLEFGIDPIQKPFVHPDYDVMNKYKDIALIKLDRSIDFQTYYYIKPICLPTSPRDHNLMPSDDVVLAGWGLTKNSEVYQSDILQKGLLKPDTLESCQKTFSLFTVDKSKLCIRPGNNNTVSCQGDSGSPIFWKTRYFRGRMLRKHYTQVGLVSLGFGGVCGGLTSVPFMYENVTDSLAWITNTILK